MNRSRPNRGDHGWVELVGGQFCTDSGLLSCLQACRVPLDGEGRLSGKGGSCCSHLPCTAWGGGLLSWQAQQEPEACGGSDLSLLSPAPLPPPLPGLISSCSGSEPQLLPSFHETAPSPVLGEGARGVAHPGIVMTLKGLGIQREASQQGASRPWEKAGARYKYLFLNKLVLGRGAKLGCEATFSPDLNRSHLDACLLKGAGVGGNDRDRERLWAQSGVGRARASCSSPHVLQPYLGAGKLLGKLIEGCGGHP